MPHDRDGNLLEVGDFVNVPCVITFMSTGELLCNVTLESQEVMPGNDLKTTISAINTKQVVKVHK